MIECIIYHSLDIYIFWENISLNMESNIIKYPYNVVELILYIFFLHITLRINILSTTVLNKILHSGSYIYKPTSFFYRFLFKNWPLSPFWPNPTPSEHNLSKLEFHYLRMLKVTTFSFFGQLRFKDISVFRFQRNNLLIFYRFFYFMSLLFIFCFCLLFYFNFGLPDRFVWNL